MEEDNAKINMKRKNIAIAIGIIIFIALLLIVIFMINQPLPQEQESLKQNQEFQTPALETSEDIFNAADEAISYLE
jgi:NADH:ubiquinone oxidoreductase subunit 6 (subunit J)